MEENYTILADIEKPTYLDFHKWAYKDNIKLARYVLKKSPRWTIIISYFAMHDITKLYLGKVHNKKISGINIHAKTIKAMKECVEEEQTKERIIKALEKAKQKYELFVEGDETIILDILKQAREERSKHQYYQNRFSSSIFEERVKQEANDFLNNITKPFIEFMENLMGNKFEKESKSKKEGNNVREHSR